MSLLAKVVKTAPSLPPRIFLYAAEKFGKTSFACYAPNPIFVMSEGETGLKSLLEAGRVPETAHFPSDCKSWIEFTDNLKAVLKEPHDYKTLVIDTANGIERLAVRHVIKAEFGGNMSDKGGYASFGKGDKMTETYWAWLLTLLDEIREKRNMGIILLSHTKTKSMTNPDGGEDYNQICPEGNEKFWGLTNKWADIVMYGGFDISTDGKKKRVTDTSRYLRTTGNHATKAGNRYGLPERIACGGNASSAWNNFDSILAKCKKSGTSSSNNLWQEIEREAQAKGTSYENLVSALRKRFARTTINRVQDLSQEEAELILASYRKPKDPPNEGGSGGSPSEPVSPNTNPSQGGVHAPQSELEKGSVPMEQWEDDPINDSEPASSDNYGTDAHLGTIAQELLNAAHKRNMTWPDVREFAKGKLNRVLTNETKIMHLSGVEIALLLQEVNKLPKQRKRQLAHA